MLKIVRIYNQNRKLIWTALIIAIFSIAMIRVIGNAYQEQTKENLQKRAQQMENNTETQNEIQKEKASVPLTSGEKIDKSVQGEIQKTLELFLKSICENKIQEAYSYLTRDCKEIQYPSVEIFEHSYCNGLANKTYGFELWSSSRNIYIYQVKFLDDLLSSGRDTSRNYLQDYVTVIKQDDSYKLNINKFIKQRELASKETSRDIEFKLKKVETYLDYENYEIEITNKTSEEIILDPRQEEGSVYIKNSDGLKISALLYENKKEDLKIEAGETKTIKIKFNNTYNGEKSIRCVGFSKVIYDNKTYNEDEEKKAGTMEVEIVVNYAY